MLLVAAVVASTARASAGDEDAVYRSCVAACVAEDEDGKAGTTLPLYAPTGGTWGRAVSMMGKGNGRRGRVREGGGWGTRKRTGWGTVERTLGFGRSLALRRSLVAFVALTMELAPWAVGRLQDAPCAAVELGGQLPLRVHAPCGG